MCTYKAPGFPKTSLLCTECAEAVVGWLAVADSIHDRIFHAGVDHQAVRQACLEHESRIARLQLLLLQRRYAIWFVVQNACADVRSFMLQCWCGYGQHGSHCLSPCLEQGRVWHCHNHGRCHGVMLGSLHICTHWLVGCPYMCSCSV